MMLKSLKISNFAIISELEIEFKPGLNVLTGETGSGKSIIVDALSLLIGGRSSSAQIRGNETNAVVEGVFQIPVSKLESIKEILEEIGLHPNEELVVRREINVGGRGTALINKKNVSASLLRKLQPFLAEIYGQGEYRSLLSSSSHRAMLDSFGKCVPLADQVRKVFSRLQLVKAKLKLLEDDRAEQERLKDFLEHQLREIRALNIKKGEDDELLAERRVLVNSEKIIELCSSAYHALYESDDSILGGMAVIRRQVEELSGMMGNIGDLPESIKAAMASLNDVAEALRGLVSKVEHSPARLAEVESRLAELEKFKRKYNTDLEGIVKVEDELSAKLEGADNREAQLSSLRKEAETLRRSYIEAAKRLTVCRRKSAPILEQRIMEGLQHVALEQAKFLVSVETAALEDHSKDGIEGTESDESSEVPFFSQNGADKVEFWLSANPGEIPRPLSYVASGGELSRLMLTLRTSGQSEEGNETAVFDEIDAGIGGRVAEAVGRRLKSLSAARQVFCVTHQAQIARFADHHFVVTKSVQRGRTSTSVSELSREERIGELALMIGGDETTEKTRQAAQWLLEKADVARLGRSRRAR